MVSQSIQDKLAKITIHTAPTTETAQKISFGSTSDKDYAKLQSFVNTTSYSVLSELHTCPRKYQLIKARAARGESARTNVDFAFGHSVGAGVQNWIMTRDLDVALFNGFLAWNISFGAVIEKKHKSIWDASVAIMKYPEFHEMVLEEWDVLVLPNGKPAIELSISVDFENGYKHYVHIDVILRNRDTGQLAVQENKTTGFNNVEEAIYGNSMQALFYAVLVDMLAPDTSFEVFYAVYSTTSREWTLMPFTKSTKQKAEALNDIRLDHAAISTYRQIGFYPKRGESCFNFMRRCDFYGDCNIVSHLMEGPTLLAGEEAETVDFAFTLTEILENQRNRIGVSE